MLILLKDKKEAKSLGLDQKRVEARAEDSRSTDSFLNLKLFLDLSEAASALDCFEESKYKIIVAEVEAKECAGAYQEGKGNNPPAIRRGKGTLL